MHISRYLTFVVNDAMIISSMGNVIPSQKKMTTYFTFEFTFILCLRVKKLIFFTLLPDETMCQSRSCTLDLLLESVFMDGLYICPFASNKLY